MTFLRPSRSSLPHSRAGRRLPRSGLLAFAAIGLLVPAAAVNTGTAATERVHPIFVLSAPLGRVLLAGLLPLDHPTPSAWPACGAWSFPVGSPFALGAPGPGGEPGFRVARGVAGESDERHDGADLLNGRGGDPVRAAAHGIVVRTAKTSRGYGAQIVLGHRLEDGTLVYSIYAHLDPASISVERGAIVHAGQRLGRVGRSGRATTNHLHFEIRLPKDPTSRWEWATTANPIEFLTTHLPPAASDTTWARPYLEWAHCAALVREEPGDRPLYSAVWWSVLAKAAGSDLPPSPEAGAVWDSLQAAGVLATAKRPGSLKKPIGWTELREDVDRLRLKGAHLPLCRVEPATHRRLVAERLKPLSPEGADGRIRSAPPTLADALLAMADLAFSIDEDRP